MNMFTLAKKSLLNRKSTVLLTLLTIAVSVMLLLGVERIRTQAKASFANTISGTDLIVGARTGSINLLLYSVFRIGHATHNVSWQSYENIKKHSTVKWAIPLSLGDSHKGFPVLGTTPDYFKHYKFAKKQPLAFAQGHAFKKQFDIVLGASIAKKLGYKLNDEVVVSHGAGNTSFHHHDEHPFTVVGILKPTGTPLDKTLHLPLIAIDKMHDSGAHAQVHEHEHDHEHHNHDIDLIGEPKQITAFLLGLKSRIGVLTLQRSINTDEKLTNNEALLAIIPGLTLRQLWEMLSMVEQVLLVISGFVVVSGLLGMLTSLLTSLNQRRRELAILRSLGARPWQIGMLLVSESVLLTATGCIIGIGLLYAVQLTTATQLQETSGLQLSFTWLTQHEMLLIAGVLLSGLLVGLIPAWRAYKYSLSDGMSIRV
ncbi:peptide ABC transporter permease [Pseudoalteromonas sp. NBT06-2]|uniref:ABC transporter permease n=1 Tax=Pseudoalteromonas sp. NBT06-2 TaxID=2025950 RepID=UPI000BA5A360|nr:ABC transporter permease [Pseudoalteromonas sp. NBT06-2]PAJ72000.1 peptide ABC transporter permease [Pseudoalteromonas sp. NBT06-2]